MTSRLGVLLDWTAADFLFLAVAVWQYISISQDLKRTKTKEEKEKQDSSYPEKKAAK